ncbi:tetratricopeptide repeat protein [Psychroserpens sp.]|uniref:tetratricopeptide repeat protein n=1 Tax=Psychroserpens sp. TaxID=2020870 RepID=UPI00385F42DC
MNRTDADSLFFEADVLLSDNKIVEAKDILLEVLLDYPDYGKAHNHLGWIFHYKLVDYDKAETHYKLSIKYSKGYYAAYSNYSYFLIDKGQYKEMLKFGEEALKVSGVDKGIIYNQMAKANELRVDLMDAYKLYNKAKMNSIASNYIEEINASLQRLQGKMNFFERLKIIFK